MIPSPCSPGQPFGVAHADSTNPESLALRPDSESGPSACCPQGLADRA